MANLAVVSVKAADTVTNVVLTPISKIGNNISYRDLVKADVRLREQLNVSFRPGNLSSGVKDKTTEQVVIPYEVTSTNTGLTSVEYATLSMSFNIPVDAPLAVRTELLARVNMSANAQLVDLVKDSAIPY